MEHAENYEIRCEIIGNIRTKRVAPFFPGIALGRNVIETNKNVIEIKLQKNVNGR